MQHKALRALKAALPVLVFLFCLTLSVGTFAVYGQHNLDSDMSSEFVLAQLLNEEGKLALTDSWYYSSELRVVSPIPVYQLALRLFHSWHAARTFSIAVLLCGVALSLIYLARALGVSMTASLLCASALVLPITVYQAFTQVYGGFYTVYVMLTFIEIGLVLRMDKKRWIEPLLLIVLGIYGGMNGVRMPMVCVAPLLAACALAMIPDMCRCNSWKEIVKLPIFRFLLGGLLLTAATLIGYEINGKVLANLYDFERYNGTTLTSLSERSYVDQLMALASFLGYRDHVQLISLEGAVSLLAILFPVLAGGVMIALLRMKLSNRERIVTLYVPIALLTGMLINTLVFGATIPYSVSYYTPAFLLLIFAPFWMLERFECRMRALRVLPMLTIVCVFLAGNAVYRKRDVRDYKTELENVAESLMEEECVQGYATFWNANVLTEITDGRIEVCSVIDWDDGEFYKWLQRKDHEDWTPEGRVFAIFTIRDYQNGVPGCDDEHIFYKSDDLCIVIYDSNEAFLAARGEA